MIPRPGTKIEQAIAFIRAQNGARSAQIARHLDCDADRVSAMLAPYVDDHTLVVCKIDVPGTRQQNEYRLSAGGPMPKVHRTPRAPRSTEFTEVKCNAPRSSVSNGAAASSKAGEQTERPTPAAGESLAFRCALFSDGQMLLEMGHIEMRLNEQQTQHLLHYLDTTINANEARS